MRPTHYEAFSTGLPAVRVALAEEDQAAGPSDDGRVVAGGVVAGIVVGSVVGGVVLIVLLGLLIRCLCQRRQQQVSTDHTEPPGKPAPHSGPKWSCCFGKRGGSRAGRRPRVPPYNGIDKQDGEISDTSFVLPELGGPNPHNKFDGMEWVDIKGLDDDHLQDISTDLRKYSQGQQRRS